METLEESLNSMKGKKVCTIHPCKKTNKNSQAVKNFAALKPGCEIKDGGQEMTPNTL